MQLHLHRPYDGLHCTRHTDLNHETLGAGARVVLSKDFGSLWRQEILVIEAPDPVDSFFRDIPRVEGRTWNLGRHRSCSQPNHQVFSYSLSLINVIINLSLTHYTKRPSTINRQNLALLIGPSESTMNPYLPPPAASTSGPQTQGPGTES